MSRILIGTCSWSDKELVESGRFYPPDVKTPERRLVYYASRFPLVEVDSTYYGIPEERTAYQWVERTPPGFVFDVKAFRLFTAHPTSPRFLPKTVQTRFASVPQGKNLYPKDVPAEAWGELWDVFDHVLRPLHQVGKLGVVLLQFPPWFLPSHENREHILRCKERLPDYRAAVEFRAASWVNERNFERTVRFLEEHDLAYVCVDSPSGFSSSLPPIALATSDISLVRFHGRNRETWERRTGSSAERFDYWYMAEDFQEWVPKVRDLADRTGEVHLLMNTNRANQGPANAAQMELVLQQAGLQ